MDPREFTDRDLVAQVMQKTASCLAIAQLETAASGQKLQDAAAQAHLAGCPHCQAEVAMMAEFCNATPTASELAAVQQIERKLTASPAWRPAPAAPWWKALFAKPMGQFAMAGLAAMLAIGIYVQQPGSQTNLPPFDDGAVRSASIEGVEPAGDIAQAPSTLRWQGAAKAASYRVRLLDVDNAAIWQVASKSSQVEVPASARALMLNKKTLFWQIEALDAKGAAIAQSTPTQFRVVSPN